MKISWIGHASFRIDLSDGRSLVTDPFDPAVGYALPARRADIVTMSHEHHDHNYIGALAPETVIREPGVYVLDGVRVEGIPSFHDDAGGKKRGRNVIFVIEADGARVAHLGDLGHDLTDADIARLGALDVLMIPVGGVFTIDAAQAAALAKRIGARVTVPMHFSTDRLSFRLGGVDAFLAAMGGESGTADALDPAQRHAPVTVLNYGQGL
ncbi:MAG: MBL fold metallo-hydrolase [Clostridia bacterium]|nr:MBL fold metallo-hydrolase [Clostridia bacterium]